MPRRLKFASRPGLATTTVSVAVGLALAVGSGCFAPRYENAHLICAGEPGVCPRGFYCATIDNRCYRLGEMPPMTPPDSGIDVMPAPAPDAADVNDALPPTVARAASASPSPVLGTSTALSVLGEDPQGESTLSYSWSFSPAVPVGFTINGNNAAKNTTAIFTAAGDYTFTVTIQNRNGLTATSAVDVQVQQRVNDMALDPSMATVPLGGAFQFKVMAFDQFGGQLALPVAVRWLLTGGCGVVNDSGLFQAGPTMSGTCTITATTGAVMVTGTVSVGTSPPIQLPPAADAFVEEGMPDRNFGTAANLVVKTQSSDPGNNRIAYLRFPLAGVPGPVTAAKLRLFGQSKVDTHPHGVFAVSDPTWTEAAITWRNKPALGARVGRINVTTAPKYHEWDITTFVQARQAAEDGSINVAVQMEGSSTEAPDSFESREAAANKPQLVLTP